MPRHHRLRPSSPRHRRTVFIAIAAVAVLFAAGNWIGFLDEPPTVSSRPGLGLPLLEIAAPMIVRRANYNYSVIPGGAFDGQELTRAVNRDAVVAEHYSDVDPSTMRPEILQADRMAYVSYRLGDRVYWTSKKVRIPSGETILTNGQTEIRARCGNCISMAPLMPTSADEPDAMQLDALTDTGPIRLEAPDTSPLLMAWALTPLAPLVPGGPVGVELGPVATTPFGLPLFPFPSEFPVGPTAGQPDAVQPGNAIAGSLAPEPGVGTDTTPPGAATPPGAVTPPGAFTPPGAVTPPLGIGPAAPGLSIDAPFRFDTPDALLDELPTTRLAPPASPLDATPVPEPATLVLLGGGLAGLIARRLRSSRPVDAGRGLIQPR